MGREREGKGANTTRIMLLFLTFHDAFDEERGQKEVGCMAKMNLLENLSITII